MLGLLILIMFAFCLLLVVEGARALQFAIAVCEPTKNWRRWTLGIGIVVFLGAAIGALVLMNQFYSQADAIVRALGAGQSQP